MSWKSDQNPMFRSQFAEDIFVQKYRHEGALTWAELARTLVEDVCQHNMHKDEKDQLVNFITDLKFIPGGRYLYYAGRKKKFFNNCYLLKAEEDSREDWADLSKRSELCLSTGGGIGIDYSIYRAGGSLLHGTGGVASGPIAKMRMINEIGREVMQGGSRRSAIYASLSCRHRDVGEFMQSKNWHTMPVAGTDKTLADLKFADFNFRAPLDMTNISVNYDTRWLLNYWETGELDAVFLENCKQALSTGEPGFSFNFFDKEDETLRNACTEVTSEDDSDVCNLGSINIGRIDSIKEFCDVVNLATKFLLCGTLVAHLPYDKVTGVREKNRRLGLGLMGIHEWLIKKGERYEVTKELHNWMSAFRDISTVTARKFSAKCSVSIPVACRAIAPTGSIGILAGTTTGIEPLFAAAYKRRYLKSTRWYYQYVVDSVAEEMHREYGVNPDDLETAMDLATQYERRIKFQADIQDYIDMGISSTINLPMYNPDIDVTSFANVLASYCHRLRGFTCYPSGSRGGQPLEQVSYADAEKKLGRAFEEHVETIDMCELTGRGGVCNA